MKQHKFYSMPAKMIVTAGVIISMIVTGLCTMRVVAGCAILGASPSEMQDVKTYEMLNQATADLNSKASSLLAQLAESRSFETNGVYDENATIDISNLEAGVDYTEKNENLSYSLADLEAFYQSKHYYQLNHLVENYLDYVYVPEDDGVIGVENVYVEYEDDESEGIDTFPIVLYATYYECLFYNGKSIETQANLLSAAGTTVADYVDTDKDKLSILDSYRQLLDAASAVNDYLISTNRATSDNQEQDTATNVVVYLKNLDTNEVFTNVEAWKKINFSKVLSTYSEQIKENEDYEQSELYILKDGEKDPVFPEWMAEDDEKQEILNYISENVESTILNEENGKANYQLFAGVASYEVTDRFEASNVYFANYMQGMSLNWLIALAIVGAGVSIAMLVLICLQIGHRKDDKEIHAAAFDRFPLELMFIMDIVIATIVISLFVFVLEQTLSAVSGNIWSNSWISGATFIEQTNLATVLIGVCCGVLAAYLAWVFTRYGRRIKQKDIGGSLIASTYQLAKKSAKEFYGAKKANQKLVIEYAVFIAGNLVLGGGATLALLDYAEGAFLLFLILLALFYLIVLRFLFKRNYGRQTIIESIREMRAGNLHYQINTDGMHGDLLEMAENLSGVQEGLKHAVEIEMKSERLKTDLITNVSHDIKTPLTSIINYVDILKRENIEDEKIAGYIDVLDRKSQRLKQLTDDLVEASKISSGNVSLQMEKINLKQLIKQTNGEFEEKFVARDLDLVLQVPEGQMFIYADGRRMFRVIENLYHNAEKYSMPHSRVYVNGDVIDGKVVFSMKNVSENPLNFSADELMERFVRGDVSRSTEGSGLGLEIAKNLTEMQKGVFELYVDGDLFKVTITFEEEKTPM